MNHDVIERIRDRWQKLRLLRSRGTVLVDYRILKNFVRIYQALERQHETGINQRTAPVDRSVAPALGRMVPDREDRQGDDKYDCQVHGHG